MPQQLGTLLKLIADKAGIDTTDRAFADLLSINAQVGDEAFNAIKTGIDKLMDEQTAKNSSELHRHFKALTLAPVDKFMNEQLEALGLDEEFKTAFKANNNSYDKIKKLLAEATRNTSGQAQQQLLQAEIDRLNTELQTQRTGADAERQRIQAEAAETITGYAVEAALEGRNYANTNLTRRENVLAAKTLLLQELAAKNATLLRDDTGALQLVNKNDTQSAYAENNTPVSFGAFVDTLLAKHNMLKVTDSPRADKTPLSKPFVAIPADQANQAVQASNNANLLNLERALQ